MSQQYDDDESSMGQNAANGKRSRSRSPRPTRWERDEKPAKAAGNCFNCGEAGHMARKCPEPKRGTGGALLKILVPDVAGGGIIGKKGANMQEMEQQSGGGKMKISSSGMFYPGTDRERILLLTGTVDQITVMNTLVMEKLEHERSVHKDRSQTVRMIIPDGTAGLVIGKGGADIKALKASSKALIIVNSSNENAVKGERTITVSGELECVHTACKHIIEKVSCDDMNLRNDGLSYDNVDVRRGDGRLNDGGRGGDRDRDDRGRREHGAGNLDDILGSSNPLQAMLGQYQQQNSMQRSSFSNERSMPPMQPPQQQPSLASSLPSSSSLGGLDLTKVGGEAMKSMKQMATINIEVPEAVASAILSSGSNVLGEFRKFSGAEIDLSARSDYTSRGSGRMLTIFGSLHQVQIAYVLVSQKIDKAASGGY